MINYWKEMKSYCGRQSHVQRTLSIFGHEEPEARRIVIFGGGNIGLFLAQQIEAEQPSVNIKVIEADKSRAEIVARNLKRSVVLNGDVLDPEIMEEANVASAEAVIAVTNDDQANILASLLSKRAGSGVPSRSLTTPHSNRLHRLSALTSL